MRVKWSRKRRLQAGCVLAGFLLYGAAMAAGLDREGTGVLERSPHGEGETVYQVAVDGLLPQETEISVAVGERAYTDEEAEEIFDRIWGEMPSRILGENPSLDQVRTDLNLISRRDDYGVTVDWSGGGEWIDSLGRVYGEQASPEGEEVWLQAELSDGSRQAVYELPVIVYPPARTEEERTVPGGDPGGGSEPGRGELHSPGAV